MSLKILECIIVGSVWAIVFTCWRIMKKIYQELVEIGKELQTIRGSLEPKKTEKSFEEKAERWFS